MHLALFDFDGTLTSCETLPLFVRFAVSPARLAFGTCALAPLVFAYRRGWISGVRIREAIARVGFSGMSTQRYQALGQAFARDYLPGVLLEPGMQRLQWHRARGDRVVVVSGGWDIYLQPWCESQGLELLCSRLETRGERLSGRFEGAQCVAAEKARRVRERYTLSEFESVFAHGDTPEDRELLALADTRFYRWQPMH